VNGARPSLRRVADVLGVAIAVVGLAFVVRVLVRDREAVLAALDGVAILALLPALLLGLVAMGWIGASWRRCLAVLGAPEPLRAALHQYFVGQLGKYVPGGIWPVVGRAEMARRGGVPRLPAYGSTTLSLVFTYLAAVLTAAAAWAVLGRGGSVLAGAVLALLPLGLIALHPRVLHAVLGVARRATGRDLDVPVPGWGISTRLVVRHVPAWLAISGATWIVAVALGANPDPAELVLATTVSWVVGFLAIGVPGGLGVREAVFIGLATSIGGPGTAAATALVARILFVLVDLTGAGVSSLVQGRNAERTVG
jgi:glycosyltransferase 2 family protein